MIISTFEIPHYSVFMYFTARRYCILDRGLACLLLVDIRRHAVIHRRQPSGNMYMIVRQCVCLAVMRPVVMAENRVGCYLHRLVSSDNLSLVVPKFLKRF